MKSVVFSPCAVRPKSHTGVFGVGHMTGMIVVLYVKKRVLANDERKSN
jgi:hypothetical protein